jgi:hypothetical protein
MLCWLGLKGSLLPNYIYNTIFWISLIAMMGDYFLYQNVFVAEGIESKSKYNYINHLKKWQQKKTVSRDPLIKRIIDTWSLDVETATEITKYIEYLLRDFITPWYSKSETFLICFSFCLMFLISNKK